MKFIGDGGHAGNLRWMIDVSSEGNVLAYGGLTCEALEARYNDAIMRGGLWPNIIHPNAYFTPWPGIGDGNHLMVNSTLQNGVMIGSFNIINTGAIIEHDTVIGNGCHIAPGAIVLGDCKIGDFCFIGAGAIVIQGSIVPDRTFIKAGAIWNKK